MCVNNYGLAFEISKTHGRNLKLCYLGLCFFNNFNFFVRQLFLKDIDNKKTHNARPVKLSICDRLRTVSAENGKIVTLFNFISFKDLKDNYYVNL